MRCAIIENGVIVNAAEAEAGFAAEQGWPELPAEFGPGDLWDGEAFSHPVPPLSARKEALVAEVEARRDSLIRGGFTYDFGAPGPRTLQTRDNDDKINWLTSQAAYSAAVAMGQGAIEGAEFRDAANGRFTVTYSAGLAALLAMAAWGSAVYQRSWDLKDAIDAASSHDDLDDIDIEAGWPA